LIAGASAKKFDFVRAIALERASNGAQYGNFFCAIEFFLQKRVAQFQQLRTTNQQVTSVFTRFNFQTKRTPGRSFD